MFLKEILLERERESKQSNHLSANYYKVINFFVKYHVLWRERHCLKALNTLILSHKRHKKRHRIWCLSQMYGCIRSNYTLVRYC